MTSSTKRRPGRAIATGVVCLALAGGAAVAITVRDPKKTTTLDTPTIFKTATVSTGDLTTTERIDGIVQLSSTLAVLHRIEGQTSSSSNSSTSNSTTASSTPISATETAAPSSPLVASTDRITQTITSIVSTNTSIHQGDVLYTVEGAPVVAFDGALPAWRSLSTSSDEGADIAQLEASLVALGYDPGLKVTVDNHFDSATRTMVKAWQLGLGLEQTGSVALGSVVFVPTATTVSAVNQTVGGTVGEGDTVLTLAAATQEVLVDVPSGEESQVIPGLAVQIGEVEGTVARLRSADRDGTLVVEAVIAPTTPIANANNGAAVTVTLTLTNDAGVLLAPAEALVSRLDGSYAVQVQTPDGTTTWLTVELLGVSGGNVAIQSVDLTAGTVVLLPA